MNTEKLIELAFDPDQCGLVLTVNVKILIIFIILAIVIYFGIKFINKKWRAKSIHHKMVPVEMTFEVGGASIKYDIISNYSNIEIAHKIYIELITRKAAIRFDEENDVIIEVYNSWYSLFQVTRNELKTLSGDLLHYSEKSKDLIRLATDILNKGLRPHLTKYQAEYRKWYQERMEIEKTKPIAEKKSPQMIDKEYPKYNELIVSIRHVNDILLEYSEQLEKIVENE